MASTAAEEMDVFEFDSPGRDYAVDGVFHMQHTWLAGASRAIARFALRGSK